MIREQAFNSATEYLGRISNNNPIRTCFIFGVLLSLALPPFHFFPIIFICFPVALLCIINATHYKQLFIRGFAFSLGFHVASIYWVSNALLVHGWKYAWAYPFAMFGLPAVCALFNAFTLMLFKPLKKDNNIIWNIVLFSLLWFVASYARGHMFTGLPWTLIGYSWASSPLLPMLQSVSIFGIYGLSLLTVLWGTSLAIILHNKDNNNRYFCTIVTATLLLNLLYGCYHLYTNKTSYHDDVNIRLVQANIAQEDKWKPELLGQHFKKYLSMSATQNGTVPDIVIWPETTIPFAIKYDYRFKKYIEQHLNSDSILIAGVLDITQNTNMENTKAYNRIGVFNNTGKELYHYDKYRLVPFGEYMPLAKYLPFDPVASGNLKFTAGDGRKTARIEGTNIPPFSPLICYDVIFPGTVALKGNDRPEWLFNATNDGWYGFSSSPFQHLAISRTRAVEEGLPMVRSAGTGISAVFDGNGRTVGRLPLHEEGILDIKLPQAIKPTLYSYFGT